MSVATETQGAPVAPAGGNKLGLLWGAKEIGEALGLTERRAYHMLEARRLPARKIGGRWCTSIDALRKFTEVAP